MSQCFPPFLNNTLLCLTCRAKWTLLSLCNNNGFCKLVAPKIPGEGWEELFPRKLFLVFFIKILFLRWKTSIESIVVLLHTKIHCTPCWSSLSCCCRLYMWHSLHVYQLWRELLLCCSIRSLWFVPVKIFHVQNKIEWLIVNTIRFKSDESSLADKTECIPLFVARTATDSLLADRVITVVRTVASHQEGCRFDPLEFCHSPGPSRPLTIQHKPLRWIPNWPWVAVQMVVFSVCLR